MFFKHKIIVVLLLLVITTKFLDILYLNFKIGISMKYLSENVDAW